MDNEAVVNWPMYPFLNASKCKLGIRTGVGQ